MNVDTANTAEHFSSVTGLDFPDSYAIVKGLGNPGNNNEEDAQ